MKGMELPINMIVVVLIAVLVLVTVSVFLSGQLGGGTGSINLAAAYTKGCQQLRDVNLYNCAVGQDFAVRGFKPQGSTTDGMFFRDICPAQGYEDSTVCARSCGCQLP